MGILLTCIAIFLQFYSPDEALPSLAHYRVELILLVVGLVLSVPTLTIRRFQIPHPQALLMLAFWAAIVVSHLAHLWIRSAFESLVYFAPIVSVYFLVAINAYSIRRIQLIAGTLVLCGVVMSIEGILAYHTGYKGSILLLYQPDDFRYALGNRIRSYGILNDPNDFAQFLLICISLLGLFWKKNARLLKLVLLLPAGVMLYGVYLTFSRGAIFGLCALIYFALQRKVPGPLRFVIALATLGSLVIFHFTGNREVGVEHGRMIAWGAGISGFLHRPLFGIGFNHFTDINDLTAHNTFVLCFAELGIFGYFFWLAFVLTTLRGLSALAKAPDSDPKGADLRGSVIAMQTALGAFLATGFFLSRTYQPTMYILIAMAGNLIQLNRTAVPEEARFIHKWAPKTLSTAMASVAFIYALVKLKAF